MNPTPCRKEQAADFVFDKIPLKTSQDFADMESLIEMLRQEIKARIRRRAKKAFGKKDWDFIDKWSEFIEKGNSYSVVKYLEESKE